MSNFKNWIITNRKKVGLGIGLFLIIFMFFIVKEAPGYIEMYKNIQSAKVSLLNDDLEGALVSYEKAYQAVKQKVIEENIDEVKQLITSKSNYLKGERANQNKNYDSAYYYYQNVIPSDEERYEKAQDELKVVAQRLVESIYEEVDDLYDKHLYLMIMGKLELALSYGVNVEETQEKIDYYQNVLFEYYVDRAKTEASTYFNHKLFYSLFLNSLEEAVKYATTDAQVEELSQLRENIIAETVNEYYELANIAVNDGKMEEVKIYYEMISAIDVTSEEASALAELL
ncbi:MULTISPECIES: hypothetical protein [Turicibacter]|uniref:Uncharacterized protein n=2 Tax=Turicibacter sanguinis TaxID=154288 RepID=A0A9X4XGZ4_9FIRM|nr:MULTISPECIES: hypothetical protein [Turicibacter]KAB6704343.1 hypothetical protein GAZ90_10415 [Phocaeicola vulgatus]EFF64749.1 hypothetical protein CUW_1642 [Turicibacter sanguinis PC909]MBP3903059.1 hypothetical protein [Turicibacter sp.]MCU7190273.1 hypothetical protein [Turicibacter sanguinis]MCU7197423.1 hypothetical protein [Turicibacter sanguinis]